MHLLVYVIPQLSLCLWLYYWNNWIGTTGVNVSADKSSLVMIPCYDVLVINATIHQQPGFFKPDPYVELSVDEQSPPRKTEVIAKSLSPTWNEHFTV